MSWENHPGFCPACKAVVAQGVNECLACGCVFDKWNAKQARSSVGAFREKETRAQAQFQPSYDVAPKADPPSPLWKRLSGALAGAAAAAFVFWLYSPGAPAAPPAASLEASKGGFSFVAPAGWTTVSHDANCRAEGCVVAAFRLEGPAARVNPNITLTLLDRAPGALAKAERRALEAELVMGLTSGNDTTGAVTATDVAVDGLPALKLEASGTKHVRVQVAAQVAMNADAYLREQQAKNPGRGVYTVMARQDYSRPHSNPYVVTQQAQYSEFMASKTDGVVMVPLSKKLLRVSYEHDQADAASASAALDEFLKSMRVTDRSRPVDRLGPLKPAAQFGAIGLVFAAVFLLLT